MICHPASLVFMLIAYCVLQASMHTLIPGEATQRGSWSGQAVKRCNGFPCTLENRKYYSNGASYRLRHTSKHTALGWTLGACLEI